MDNFEQEFNQLVKERSPQPQLATFSRRERSQLLPKQQAADFLSEHWQLMTGVVVLGMCVVMSLPAQQRNREEQGRLAETVRPIAAQIQQDAALNALSGQKNQIAEDRFNNPNCVAVWAVTSGEPVYNTDRRLVSAGSTVCGLDGSTGETVGHPTERIDAVTGAPIMRPIADKVYSSKGAAFEKFKSKWGQL